MGETETETEALTSILNQTIIFAFMQFFRLSLICQETKKKPTNNFLSFCVSSQKIFYV